MALQCLPGTELVFTLMGGLTSLVKRDRKLRLAKAPQDCMHFISSALASETQWRPASWVPARGDAIGNCGSNSKPRNCDGMTGKREVDRFVRPISTEKRASVDGSGRLPDGRQTESYSAKSGYNKGTIRSDIRYLVVSKDVRRHRLISIVYITTLRCHGKEDVEDNARHWKTREVARVWFAGA